MQFSAQQALCYLSNIINVLIVQFFNYIYTHTKTDAPSSFAVCESKTEMDSALSVTPKIPQLSQPTEKKSV